MVARTGKENQDRDMTIVQRKCTEICVRRITLNKSNHLDISDQSNINCPSYIALRSKIPGGNILSAKINFEVEI